MLKRAVVCFAAGALALVVSGCAKSVSGSVSSVVSECQEFSTSEDVHVEVTGEVAPYSSIPDAGEDGIVMLKSGDDWVNAFFTSLSEEDVSALRGGRETITGDLKGDWTHGDSITIENCSVK